jgi:hypothetical protein
LSKPALLDYHQPRTDSEVNGREEAQKSQKLSMKISSRLANKLGYCSAERKTATEAGNCHKGTQRAQNFNHG